ncbi:HNH endonuclease [Candidatus Poriferisodalis sp.]|uniref:HNH endonuclease n=1 Tax=Candidatus Poriferisodalis sp. TaxID=3101277 RepID=UPI003B0214EF
MTALSDYLDLSEPEAVAQWRSILQRRMPPPGKRQVNFTPVETLLCYGLFLSDDPVVDPRRYGGQTIHKAPELVHHLAVLFKRRPSSITNKMMNLNGDRMNGAKYEVQIFERMGADVVRYYELYGTALRAARRLGVGARRLPDFLRLEQVTDYAHLGLEDVENSRYEEIIEREAARFRAAKLQKGQELSAAETTRIVRHRARVGQKAFATEVLRRFDFTCGFCGMAPRSLKGNRLIVASHIKPWADSTNSERRDPRNGVAACPTHDAAFDKGLITVNGGLRVHRSRRLRASLQQDEGVEHNFGESLREALVLPLGIEQPRPAYLRWHHEHVYQDSLR